MEGEGGIKELEQRYSIKCRCSSNLEPTFWSESAATVSVLIRPIATKLHAL